MTTNEADKASAGAPKYPYALSTGLFGLPAKAKSVDWALVNDSGNPKNFRVTVYKCAIGEAKSIVPPGPVTGTLAAAHVTHNANSVSTAGPFAPGFYYEIVVEVNSLAVMPTVEIWEDHGGTVIPGTTILPGTFTRIK